MSDTNDLSHEQLRLEQQFDDIVQTLARLALLCRVDLTTGCQCPSRHQW